jgi:hypothetical protein
MTNDEAPTYAQCLSYAASLPEFVAEFDRLHGTHLAKLDRRTPLDAMIDDATGRDNAALAAFCQFVFAFVWLPLQPAAA